MRTVKLFLVLLIFTIIPGQLIRINLTETSALNLSDILVGLTTLSFFASTFLGRRSIKLPPYTFATSIIFLLWATASTVLSLSLFTPKEVIAGSLFLLRLFLYLSIPLVVLNSLRKDQVRQYVELIIFVGIIFTFLGFLQFFAFPNISSLAAYGWDPHINRLVSTTLDPNYTGMILAIFLSLTLSSFLYNGQKKYLALTVFFTLALLLTFSRSSYIALVVSMFTISAVKSPKIILIPLSIFIISFLFIPVAKERIIGALTIDKTSRSRIESWQNALQIISDYPYFGVGFNNYRSAQARYGFFQDNSLGGHSGAGSDSSLLFTTATTGFFGLVLYLGWLTGVLKIATFGIRKNFLALSAVSSFFALLVHSLFVNSLYFPQIMLLILFLIGLKHVQDF